MTIVTQHSQFLLLMAKDKIICEYSLSYQVQINFLLTLRRFSISDELNYSAPSVGAEKYQSRLNRFQSQRSKIEGSPARAIRKRAAAAHKFVRCCWTAVWLISRRMRLHSSVCFRALWVLVSFVYGIRAAGGDERVEMLQRRGEMSRPCIAKWQAFWQGRHTIG